ncbi:hypothetical protein N9H65_00895 [Planktomarina temperata]|nr:hypothetical protein [Planktomarina temperata]
MKSPNDNLSSIRKLRDELNRSNGVIEKALQLYQSGAEDFLTQRHEAFQEAFQAVVSVKNYIDSLDEDINTMPLFRILEEWRNTFEGADNVILGHSKPNEQKGGRPKIASANEYNALLIAAIIVLQNSGMKLNDALARVSFDVSINLQELRNIRTRFSRKNRTDKKYSDSAHRLSKVTEAGDKETHYQNLIKQYQLIKI